MHIGGKTVTDDQDIAFGRVSCPCKGSVEEGSLWLGRTNLLRNDQLTDEMPYRGMCQAAALDCLQSICHDRELTGSVQDLKDVLGSFHQLGTDSQLLDITRAHLVGGTTQLKGFQQQLKAAKPQHSRRDFLLFERPPEFGVDTTIDAQIVIFERQGQ